MRSFHGTDENVSRGIQDLNEGNSEAGEKCDVRNPGTVATSCKPSSGARVACVETSLSLGRGHTGP